MKILKGSPGITHTIRHESETLGNWSAFNICVWCAVETNFIQRVEAIFFSQIHSVELVLLLAAQCILLHDTYPMSTKKRFVVYSHYMHEFSCFIERKIIEFSEYFEIFVLVSSCRRKKEFLDHKKRVWKLSELFSIANFYRCRLCMWIWVDFSAKNVVLYILRRIFIYLTHFFRFIFWPGEQKRVTNDPHINMHIIVGSDLKACLPLSSQKKTRMPLVANGFRYVHHIKSPHRQRH